MINKFFKGLVTMSDEIIKVLDDLSERAGIAIDWTSQNVLPYLQELCDKYISYEIWTSAVYIFICLTSAILMLYGISKLHDILNDVDDGFLLVFGIVLIVSLVVMVVQIFDIVTALTFPEKLIYEYISYYANTH